MHAVRNSRWSALLGAGLVVGIATSCDDPTRPPTEGEIAPRIAYIQPDSMTRASLVLPLTAVRARAIGPTGKVVDLVLQGTTWRGSLTGLTAGTYEVIVEGIANSQVQFYGRLATVTVARGERVQPAMPFAAAVPTMASPALTNTTNFSQRIPFAAITAATGYVVQISQDNTFASGMTEFASPDANPLVTVTQPGTWYIRSRAVLPQIAATSIPWSETRSWVVIEANGGDDANDATTVTLTPEDPQTITSRNLTPTKREDWFDVDLREGDSLFVETFAARLAFASGLNTTLTVFENDGTTQVAQNLDAPGTTDSRVVYVAENTDTYKVRVGASASTSGHYELTTEIRRLPKAPNGLTATILSGTEVRLDWSDESDNETSFRVERCDGAACTTFAEVSSTAENLETLTLSGLTQGTTYKWRVRARNNVGNSVYTSEAVTALVGPAMPIGVTTTTLGNTSIKIDWTDASDNETGFTVNRCVVSGGCTFTELANVAAGVTTYTDATALYNTAYEYQVRANNNVVPSDFTAGVAATTIPPVTPSGVSAVVAGATTIDLSWTDNSSDETHFLIERCAGDGCTGFAQVDSVGAGITDYASTVAYNTAYRFRIRARNAVISQSYSDTASADTRPPTAPTGLSATTESATAIALSWSDNSDDETGFRIERCGTPACSDFALLTTVAADIEGYTDNTATVGNTYRYRVIAVGVPGNSAETNTADANTILPAGPTLLAAQTITASVIRLTWTDNATNEAGYRVDRCAGAACTPSTQLAVFAGDVTEFDDSTAVAGTTYTYRLYATNAAGLSPVSNDATANTNPPSAPTAFTATLVHGSRIDLAWTLSDASITGVRIERCDAPGCSDFVEVEFLPGMVEDYSDLTVTSGNQYTYRVRAQNAADVSAFTAVQMVSTELAAPPTNLTATALSGNNVTLNWTATVGPNATQYVVQRCTGAACGDFGLLTTVAVGDASYADLTVEPSNTYRYRISTLSPVGNGPASDTVEVATAVPAAPSAVAATVSAGKIALHWTDNSTDETAFHIYRCVGDPCGPFSTLVQLAPNVLTYDDMSVVANESYEYYVIAVNGIGDSPASATADASTALVVSPTVLTATTLSDTSIQLNWNDASLSETGFVIGRCAGVGCTVTQFADTVAINVATFTDVSASADESYTYQVRALAPFGASAATTSATATTYLPAAPTDFVATTLSSSVVRLEWTDVATDETEYRVGYCAGVDCVPSDTVKATAPANAAIIDITGLTSNETYTFHLWAFRPAGVSPSVTAPAATNIPAIPGNFRVNVINATDVFVVWADVADELGYEIEQCVGVGCTDFAWVASPGADENSHGLGLANGVTYRFRMRANNAAGSSAYTEPFTTTVSAPSLPTNLTATPLSATEVQLTWTDNSDNEFSQRIQRCDGAACVGSDIEVTASADANIVTLAVPGGNLYTFRIQAENGAGVSGYTADVTTSTLLPDAPTNLVAVTFSATQIDLTWDDNAAYETSYAIERCQGLGCNTFASVASVPANSDSYSDVGLTTNQSYTYRVRAVNAVGGSLFSNEETAATDLPAAPTGLTALAMAADQIDLSWTDASDNETEFLIEFCEGVSCTNFAFLALPAANTTTFQHTGLDAGASYSYRVQAVGGTGSSPFSAVATTDTDFPDAVTGFTATTASGTQINLAWNDNATNELGFSIERCTGAACGSYVPLDTVSANATGYVDTTAVVDEEYGYRVIAFNNVGVSGAGLAVANTLRPAAPSGLSVTTVGATQVDLEWTDASTNELGFLIERCVGPACVDFDTLVTLGADNHSYQDVGLAASESYTYRISAFNIAGSSAIDGPMTTTTLVPGTPASLTAEPVSANQIDVVWSDDATNELGYRIERCTGSGCTSFVEIGSVGPDVTTFASTGLVMNTFYRHRVRAYNAAGTSAYVGPLQTGTFAPTPGPSALAATTATATAVALHWNDNTTNEAGFVVQRCIGAACVDFADLDTIPPTVPSGATAYADTTAPAFATVRYRVRAYNGVGPSSFTAAVTASTVTPDEPSNFVAHANGQTAASLTWNDVATSETGYVIERCLGVTCDDFVYVDTIAANSTSFDDVTIVGDNIYRYRIYAVGNGRSDFSNYETVTTILPVTPTALIAIPISNDQVSLTWDDNATDELSYVVERCQGAACVNFSPLTTLPAGSTSYQDVGAPVGAALSYRVRAVNYAGESAPSNEQTVETFVPVIPTTLAGVIASTGQIDLTWVNDATDELGVLIERCEGDGCTNYAVIDTTAVDATSYSDTTVVADVVYRYRVRAYNAFGVSGATLVITMATAVPAAPTGLAVTLADAGTTTIEWNDVATNEVRYLIDRCDGTSCVAFAVIDTVGADATSYVDNTAAVDTTYRYRVRAENAIGASADAQVEMRTYRPLVPTAFSVTTASATRIDLAWSIADAAESNWLTEVERCIGDLCSDFSLVEGLLGSATSYSDGGLTPGLTYRYRLNRSNTFGTLGFSAEAQSSTDFPLPPASLTATTVGPTQINLAWADASSNETYFIIERCDGDPCATSYAPIDSVGVDVTAYADISVAFQSEYSYRVRALNGAGASDYTNLAGANTVTPDAPAALVGLATSPSTAHLTWSGAPTADNFIIERCELAGCASYDSVATVDAGIYEYTDASVTLGTSYRYRVVGVNAAGASAPSATDDVSMNAPTVPTPTVLLPLSPTQMRVTWGDASADETAFIIERCEGSGCSDYVEIGVVDPDSTSFVDEGVRLSGKYQYRVLAENAVDRSAANVEAFVVVEAPAIPSGLTATTTAPGQITLAWADNADNELQYAVERCTGIGCTEFVQVASLAPNVMGYVDNGLSLNAVYRYQVRALNNVGPSDYSNIENANTLLPSAPVALTATIISGARVDLAWTDLSNNEQKFRIERCVGAGCVSWVVIDSVSTDVQAYSNTGLTYGLNYNYRVKAVNISGESAPTATSVANVTLSAPTSIRATVLDRDEVQVVWAYPATWNSGYEVMRCVGAACVPVDGQGVGSVDAGTLTLRDTVPVPGSEYTYSVRAVTVNGTSSIGNLSGARTPIALSNAVAVTGLADNQSGERHFVFTVPAGALGVRFRFDTPGGDADMYVKYGETGRAGQVVNDATNCVPYTGASPELCTFNNPVAGDWFAMPQGYQAYTNASLKASLAERFGWPGTGGPQASNTQNFIIAQKVVLSEAVAVTHLGARLLSSGGNIRFAVYSNRVGLSGDEPNSLLVQTTAAYPAAGITEAAALETTLPPGTYWITVITSASGVYESQGGSVPIWYYSRDYALGFEASWPAVGTFLTSYQPFSIWFRGYR